MCAPHAEVDERLAGCRQHAARGLRGDQRLKVQDVHEPALDELRFGQRRRHAQQAARRKEDRAFRERVDIPRETQRAEPVEKLAAEELRRGQVR